MGKTLTGGARAKEQDITGGHGVMGGWPFWIGRQKFPYRNKALPSFAEGPGQNLAGKRA